MARIILQNPAGSDEEREVASLSATEARGALEDLVEAHQSAEETISSIAELVISVDDGKLSADELGDAIWEELTEFDEELYPPDDEEEE